MDKGFYWLLIALISVAVVVGLLVAAVTYSWLTRHGKRYRPGRPFDFEPVWFRPALEQDARADVRPGRELIRSAAQRVPGNGPTRTGGASDGW